MRSPVDAAQLGEALVHRAGERPGLVVVCGADPGPTAWFGEVWPDRLLTVPPTLTRLSVAEGISRGGGEAVVVLDPDVDALAIDPDVPTLVVTTDARHLPLAYRAGISVLQPGWPGDLDGLLDTGLDLDQPALLHLPSALTGSAGATADAGDDRSAPAPPGAPSPLPPGPGDPRVLHRGRDGVVIGAGATAGAAASVAERLRTHHHLHVTALDLPVIMPGSGVDASLLDDHLLVGASTAARPEAMTAIPVGPSVGTVATLVAGALRGEGRGAG